MDVSGVHGMLHCYEVLYFQMCSLVGFLCFRVNFEKFGEIAGGTSGRANSNLRALRLLRVGRLFRVVRIIRVVKFFRSLRTLVHSLVGTLRALFWALLLLLLGRTFFFVFLKRSYTATPLFDVLFERYINKIIVLVIKICIYNRIYKCMSIPA